MKAQVVSTGSCLPGPAITNADLEALAGPLPEEVLHGLQVKTRHWIADRFTGKHHTLNSDMAAAAGRQALERAAVDPADIELVVTCTSSPDFLLPPQATLVLDKIGGHRCATVELRSGCAGAVQALDLARLYIEAGVYRNALVIGSEATSPLLVPRFAGKDPERIRMRDRISIYSFGDGAGAVLLRAGEEAGILGAAAACLGGGRKPGLQVIGGGTHAPLHEQLANDPAFELRLDVTASARLAPELLVEGLDAVLHATGLRPQDIDVCVLPEGNAGYLVEEMEASGLDTGRWRGIRDRVAENLAEAGATGSAAVPTALGLAWTSGRIRPGQVVLLLALETSKWMYAGVALKVR